MLSVATLDLLDDIACQRAEVDTHQAIALRGDGLTTVTAFADTLDEGDLPEERNIQLFSQFLTTITPEDIVFVLWKLGRSEPCHILHQPKDGDLYVLVEEHPHALDGICQGYLLGCRDDECARQTERLHQRQMDIARPWR